MNQQAGDLFLRQVTDVHSIPALRELADAVAALDDPQVSHTKVGMRLLRQRAIDAFNDFKTLAGWSELLVRGSSPVSGKFASIALLSIC